MAEAAGLVLGVLGVAGLFKSCVENFDIIVSAKSFGVEYDFLCTKLSIQRLRLVLWGETLGLVPSVEGPQIPYNSAIDRQDIRPVVEEALNHLCQFLQRADVVTGRYELESDETALQPVQPTGLTIFRDKFESFKHRLRRNQKEKSVWKVTRWAVHDFDRFKSLIDNIESLIDGLENITSSLGVLAHQQSLLQEQIESISDTRSLKLLQDVTSSHGSSRSNRIVSDAASQRLSFVQGTTVSDGTSNSSSFFTAPSHQNQGTLGIISENQRLTDFETQRPAYRFESSLIAKEVEQASTSHAGQFRERKEPSPGQKKTAAEIPQHRRVMEDVLKKSAAKPQSLSFVTKVESYGSAIAEIKKHDDALWGQRSASLLSLADRNTSTARRVFLELRSIRAAAVPFISASLVGDGLDKILASIEGPPDTPYEGGVFWISVKIPEEGSPPLLRFLSRIYHPNINHAGKICADFQSWWYNPQLARYLSPSSSSSSGIWFSDRSSNNFSLGAVLTALCGLLASPNIEDPLVPEIAEVYVSDHPRFCEAAKLYTAKFAHLGRPSDEAIVFADEFNESLDSHALNPAVLSDQKPGVNSMLNSDASSLRSLQIPHDTELALYNDAERQERVVLPRNLLRQLPQTQGAMPVRLWIPMSRSGNKYPAITVIDINGTQLQVPTDQPDCPLKRNLATTGNYKLFMSEREGRDYWYFESTFRVSFLDTDNCLFRVSFINDSRWTGFEFGVERYSHGNLKLTDGGQTSHLTSPVIPYECGPVDLAIPSFGLDSFQRDAIIAKDDFGPVYKVKETLTKQVYALKIVSKDAVVSPHETFSSQDEDQYWKARFRPMVAKSRFFTQILGFFQTESSYYLIANYFPHGTLFSYLESHTRGRLCHWQTRLYAAEMITAMDILIHHDILWALKPDDILLDCTGHLILSDFGLSRGFNLGVTEYTAPETLEHGTMSKTSYSWLLGCFISQLITGKSPFHHKDENTMKQRIMSTDWGGLCSRLGREHDSLPLIGDSLERWMKSATVIDESRFYSIPEYPWEVENMSGTLEDLVDLLRRLCQVNPDLRLGSSRGMGEIKECPWFAGVPWAEVAVKDTRTAPGWFWDGLFIFDEEKTVADPDRKIEY